MVSFTSRRILKRMLKDWHKEDVFAALGERGWSGPLPHDFPKDWYYVGEAYAFVQKQSKLRLYFVADFGTGFHGTKSIESIAGRMDGDTREHDLWLNRTRDAKWRASVIEWANEVSTQVRT